MTGFLLVDKPAGWTSFDVVAKVRRLSATKRVGHAGTLDPAATGLLVLALGDATRLVEFAAATEKEYEAEILLGVTTDTDDAEGRVLSRTDASSVTPESVTAALAGFLGDVLQRPPDYSAVHVDGQRAYARARAGKDVALTPRPVTFRTLEVLSLAAPLVRLRVVCGPGTYIRALARDLGEALGVGGSLQALRRTRSGTHRVEDAHALATIEAAAANRAIGELLLKPSAAALGLASVPVSQEDEQRLRFGQPLARGATGERAIASRADGSIVAVLRARDGAWWPAKVLAGEAA